MSERAKTGWALVVIFLVGITVGGISAELVGPGGRTVEVEVCPECPQPPDCLLVCPEQPACTLVETPCPGLPEIPPCPVCICAKETEYGCLHELRKEPPVRLEPVEDLKRPFRGEILWNHGDATN